MNISSRLHEDAVAGDLIGWRRNGMQIHLIGGGAPDDDDQDDGDDTGDDDSSDDDTEDLFDQDDGGDDGDDDDGDDDKGEKVTLSKAALTKLITDEANKVADRRINQALEKRDRKTREDKRRSSSRGSGTGRDAGPSPADLREARLVYRDFIGDEIKFVGNEERSYAADLAAALLRDKLAEGADIEDAGQAVARDVATRVVALRKTYQQATIRTLQRTGALAKDFKAGTQPKRGPATRGVTADFKSGADRARALHPDRFPDQQKAN